MRKDHFLEELLVERRVHCELEIPVILHSGELSPFYEKTERLCPDGGKWEKFADDFYAMMFHAVIMAKKDRKFKKVIDKLSKCAQAQFPIFSKEKKAIAGGERRGLLFSCPTAYQLGIPHISLGKQKEGQKDRIEIIYPDGSIDKNPSLEGWNTVFVDDLIMKGSSAYRIEKGEKGWIPMLREGKAKVNHYITVLTREQGGEERLLEQNVITHPLFTIDKKFLQTHSNNPERALAYKENPHKWAEDYLMENDPKRFANYFDPKGKKQDRAFKFLKQYETVLKWSSGWKELEREVYRRYRIKFK